MKKYLAPMSVFAAFLGIALAIGLFQNCAQPLTADDSLTAASSTGTTLAIQILSYPSSQQIALGQSVVFTVSAYSSNGLALSYQWYKNSLAVAGATSNTFYISSATAADAASYFLRVTDGTNTTSTASFYLTVGSTATSLTILTNPVSQTVNLGATTRFEVVAADPTSSALSYQWMKNGVAISGQTSSEMYIATTTTNDAGYYAVTVTNSTTSVKSNTVLLTVTATTAACSSLGGTLYNSRCYIVNRTASTWANAQTTCRAAGGTLAVITTASENYFVYTLTQTSVWIGASDQTTEGSFVWVDGTAMSFSAWGTGEPSASNADEDCVEMTASGYWNDNTCAVLKPFVCKL